MIFIPVYFRLYRYGTDIFLKLARSSRQGVIPIFVAVNLFLFHHAVNYKVPEKDTDNTYIRFQINPFIADTLELQKAELRTNAYFHINHLDARVSTKRHLLEFYNKYPHSQSISLACHSFFAQPQAYRAHTALRRKWTFFTFDAASYIIPEC